MPTIANCPLCNENGNVKCIYCQGSGMADENQCQPCYGTGVAFSSVNSQPEMAIICDHEVR